MYEIEELEKKWKKYRFNKYFKIALTSILTIIFFIGIYTFLDQSKKDLEKKSNKLKISKKQDIKTEIDNQIATSKKRKLDTSISKKKIASNKNKKIVIDINRSINAKDKNEVRTSFLAPDLSFENRLNIIKKEKKFVKAKKEIKINKPPKKLETKLNPIKKEKKIVIKTTDSKNFIDSLIAKFEKEKSPKIAIFLSKHFYKEKNYKESLKWAIRANELDSNSEDSWVLFAKSSIKLGKKEDAIKALKAYLSTHNSFKVEELLNSIKTGEFK